MTTPSAVTVAELATATGLGPRQVFRLVREGELPGRILAGKLVLTRGEFDRFLAGDWRPQAKTEPLSMIHRRSA